MSPVPSRKYRPGARQQKHRAQPIEAGKMSDGRYAWLQTLMGQTLIMRYDFCEYEEEGHTIILMVPRNRGAKPISMNLSAFTSEELALTRQLFNLAFDLAEPVCALRDKVANDAFQDGDDSYTRLYRQAPRLVIREGAIAPHPKSLLGGSEDFSPGDGDDGDPSRDLRADSDGVVDLTEADSRPQDDQPTPDESEGVSEVGEVGADADGLLGTDSSSGDSSPSP